MMTGKKFPANIKLLHMVFPEPLKEGTQDCETYA